MPQDDALRRALTERYVVGDMIGEGGMARVYRATDSKHDRLVAIKVLRPELGASLGSDRFLSEIRICARLTHPHILPLYDSGAAGDLLYYVMPFIEGESLRTLLEREKRLPVDEALRIARAVAGALAHAHAHGIVHRDIKPENILLQSGEPIVADFGIAKAVSASSEAKPGATSAGMAVGTPAYMSPEQASASLDIDGRSDIYSLGCVLFEMLAGEIPYDGPSHMAIYARKLTEPVPAVSALDGEVPGNLQAVLEQAMALEPADRFATAREFAQALGGTLTGTQRATPVARDPRHSVAVLPFANLSSNPDDEFLSDGLSEELIHALSKVPELRVVARTSAFAFKGKTDDVRAIGRKLNVGAVLEGSVRRSGARLRVMTSLIKVSDGFELWSERYDRSFDDAFVVQDEIAEATVAALRVALLGEAPASAPKAAPSAPAAPSANPKAYELFLRARHAWGRRTRDALMEAVGFLEAAIKEDPGFAKAHAALADVYVTLGLYGLRAPVDVMPKAERAAERAWTLAPTEPEAYPALGCVQGLYRWNWSMAEESFRRAIEISPGYPVARHWYAMNCLAPLGRFDEAHAELTAALANDPISPTIRMSQGIVRFFARDYPGALDHYRGVLATDPGFGMGHYFAAQALEQAGEADSAVTEFQRAGELVGRTPEIVTGLARAFAATGDTITARALLAELEKGATERYVSPASLAQVCLALGEIDRAIAWLSEATTVRSTELAWLGVSPVFDAARGDPRFQELVASVGLGGKGRKPSLHGGEPLATFRTPAP